MSAIRLATALALIAATMSVSRPAAAAESYDSCNNFIDSIPASITKQGVWCLRKDLATNITSGQAINITTNNVTIDCNHFKIGGLAAGNGSSMDGVYASGRQNVTVRNCNIRGFNTGVLLWGGAGHLVEDNRLDNNLSQGIYAVSDNARLQRNAVYDTGGRTGGSSATGIIAGDRASVVDNIVSGLFADRAGGKVEAITLNGDQSAARGNHISGIDVVARDGGQVATVIGLNLRGRAHLASGNHISFVGTANGLGIDSFYSSHNNFCLGNTVSGFTTNISDDCISGGNLTPP